MIGRDDSPEKVSKHEIAHRELGSLSGAVDDLENLSARISGSPMAQPEVASTTELPLSAFLSTLADRVVGQRERIRKITDEINGLLF